ncbi:efflux RND transporter periplasmic adaptor subunit [Candidatus Albibeggiatoa sp. nov. BB20]|uniref:efflux RND transporter periplasmic adaptor subunit n=1 Tax=Candidatus Albibeggiatoa sp. nov. BB20 TaxID=3162723 RepID=UPI0033654E38
MPYKRYHILLISSLLFLVTTVQAQQVVRTETVQLQPLQQRNRVTGNLKALSEAHLAVRESGYVSKVFVNEGSRVKKGGKLLQLDKRRLNSQLAQLQAELNQAKASVKQRKAELDNAKIELEADQYSAKKKAISQRVLRSSKTSVTVSQAALQAAQASVEAHHAQIQYLKVRLADLNLYAPFSGLVTERFAEQGEWFNQGQQAISMVEDTKLEAWLDVPERFAHKLGKKPKVDLQINGLTLSSSNVVTLGKVDTKARTFTLVARFDNRQQKLMSGMSVIAWLPLGEQKAQLTVSKNALVQRGGDYMVFKVEKTDEGDMASKVEVNVLFYQDKLAAIESAELHQGDRVVNEGNERLIPGAVIAEHEMNKSDDNNAVALAK